MVILFDPDYTVSLQLRKKKKNSQDNSVRYVNPNGDNPCIKDLSCEQKDSKTIQDTPPGNLYI